MFFGLGFRWVGWRLLVLIVVHLSFTAGITNAAVVFGDPGFSGNLFPFVRPVNANLGTRYQQVYDGSLFGPGIVQIESITFFNSFGPPSTFRTADYSFQLSTSNFAVNSLDTTNLDANPGSDEALFASVSLSGQISSQFSISPGQGGSAFVFDPTMGDLLLDIVISNIGANGTGDGPDAHNGSAAGDISRAHDFGSGFSDSGLTTEFGVTAVPEPSSFAVIALVTFGVVARRRLVATLPVRY